LTSINSKLLNQFDLIILQGQQWNKQSEQDRNRILYQIQNKGLGLLILQEDVDQKFHLLNNPRAQETEITELHSVQLHSPLHALQINSKSGWRRIKYNNHVISSVKNYGLGKIQILGLNDTYKLKLEGRQKTYQQIWSKVFSTIFTNFNSDNTLIKPEWIQAGVSQEFQLLVNSIDDNIGLTHNSTSLDFIRTPQIKDHITFHVRPESGRNTIRITESGEEFSYFAHSESSWSAMRAHHFSALLEQTRRLPKRAIQGQHEDQPYPTFWWFLLFIGGFGILWVDERVFQ